MTSTENGSSSQSFPATAPEEYDLVIIGSGAGAKLAAWTFASKGQRVAVIERKYVGGPCPNIACLPSKNIIHTAQIASYVRRSDEFGIAGRFHSRTCPLSVTANAGWSQAWSIPISPTISEAARNSSWPPAASSGPEL